MDGESYKGDNPEMGFQKDSKSGCDKVEKEMKLINYEVSI